MAKFEITVKCSKATTSVSGNYNPELEVELQFDSQSDFTREIQDQILIGTFIENLGIKDTIGSMIEEFPLDSIWSEMEDQGNRLTLQSVQNQINDIDTGIDHIETAIASIDATDPDDVAASIRLIEKHIKAIRSTINDLRP